MVLSLSGSCVPLKGQLQKLIYSQTPSTSIWEVTPERSKTMIFFLQNFNENQRTFFSSIFWCFQLASGAQHPNAGQYTQQCTYANKM